MIKPSELIDSVERLGVWWTTLVILIGSVWFLLGGSATYLLWPELFAGFDLPKLFFFSALLTLPFIALGAIFILLGAMDRRPFEPEARYALFFATGSVAFFEVIALLHMYLTTPTRSAFVTAGIVSAITCLLPGFAKRREYEEDQRDFREGIIGKKSFFRGPRKGILRYEIPQSVADNPIPDRYRLMDDAERQVLAIFIRKGIAELAPVVFHRLPPEEQTRLGPAMQRLQARGFVTFFEDDLGLYAGTCYRLPPEYFRELSIHPEWIDLDLPPKAFARS